MTNIFLGFTFLLASFIPLGSQIFQILINQLPADALRNFPRVYYYLGTAISSFIFAAILVLIFLKHSRLKERLESPLPAQKLMFLGVLLTVILTFTAILATTVEGGGAAFVVSQLSPLIDWPAKLMLLIGSVNVLLAAHPLTHPSSGTR